MDEQYKFAYLRYENGWVLIPFGTHQALFSAHDLAQVIMEAGQKGWHFGVSAQTGERSWIMQRRLMPETSMAMTVFPRDNSVIEDELERSGRNFTAPEMAPGIEVWKLAASNQALMKYNVYLLVNGDYVLVRHIMMLSDGRYRLFNDDGYQRPIGTVNSDHLLYVTRKESSS